MGRKRRTGDSEKPKKRKKVTVTLIAREEAGKIKEPYAIMEELRAKEHGHLEGVNIALAWRHGWRADADGIRCLGKCRKRGDLDRELDNFDFVILLNLEAWSGLNVQQKRALIDHELCHAQVTKDADGNPKMDDQGRLVCRVRKHDCEEFRCIVERHGLWTSDLAAIAQAAVNDAERPLLAAEAGGNGNGQVDEAAEPGSLADARAIVKKHRKSAISSVVKSPANIKKLEENGVENLGQLLRRMDTYSTTWANDLKGLGDVAATAIEDDVAAYRQANPEFVKAELAVEQAEKEAAT